MLIFGNSKTILTIIKKLECLQIFKFLRFKTILSSHIWYKSFDSSKNAFLTLFPATCCEQTGRYNLTDNAFQSLEFCDENQADDLYNVGCGDRIGVYQDCVYKISGSRLEIRTPFFRFFRFLDFSKKLSCFSGLF